MNPAEQLEQVQNELLCSICYNYFLRAYTLSCSHSFCLNCINVWRANHRDCPICRSPIYSMAPSRALDNMVATFNGDQYRGDISDPAPIEIEDDDNETEEVVYDDSSHASSSSFDIADSDNEIVSDAGSQDDAVSFDLQSLDEETDPDLEYDSETDENQASPDDSHLADLDETFSSLPVHESDFFESDDDSLYDYAYPSSLHPNVGMKFLEQW
ncbi:hypothetical protein PPYR_13630 [Photinus pyralis]|uniref:RING-type domain-containing protein n=1 Tax=Photinus pyralis TaxID=7054 RepID=A0A1Y1LXB4_PHOPY|nr:E3 ubiquitin-protein ligase rnf8-B-like [Photinus pyralis]KAB0794010.1 hypothetical protein PPYR_13630 [Photinus pyralis]